MLDFIAKHADTLAPWVLNLLLAGIGFGIRKIWVTVNNVIELARHVGTFDRRLDDTASVVDVHTDAIDRSGWFRGTRPPYVSQKRRAADQEKSSI